MRKHIFAETADHNKYAPSPERYFTRKNLVEVAKAYISYVTYGNLLVKFSMNLPKDY